MTDTKFVNLYIAEMPSDMKELPLLSAARSRELQTVKSEGQRREKYFTWRLLEYGIAHTFGKGADSFNFVKNDNGRWTADGIEFSLSHSGGVSAVAISNAPVGVDIEPVRELVSSRFAERALTENELQELGLLSESEKAEFIIKKWTQKEAVFKSLNKEVFIPSKTEVGKDKNIITDRMSISGRTYILSVATAENSEFNIFSDAIPNWF